MSYWTLCDHVDCRMPGFPCPSLSPRVCSNLCPLSQWCPSNHLILSRPLLLLPSLSQHWVFSNESALHTRWPKCWSFSISPSSEYSGLISFKIDCFDLLAVQGTLKSLLQHHDLKTSVLGCSVFFIFTWGHWYSKASVWMVLETRASDSSFVLFPLLHSCPALLHWHVKVHFL